MEQRHAANEVHLEPTARMIQLATGFWVSQAIYAAARLGVADLLAEGPRSSDTLADTTSVHRGALRRLLRALVSIGIFEHGADGRYRNSRLSDCLRTQTADSLHAFVRMLGEPESWRPWGEFLHSVTTGRNAFDHVFGERFFRYMAAHPEPARIFDEAMTSRSAAENAAVLAAYDFPDGSTIVDVGGGQGGLLRAILSGCRNARGVLFDLPHVIAGARPSFENHCDSGRYSLSPGDFFKQPPPAAGDIYILKKILHDWDDEKARWILRSCRRSMSATSRLLLIEPIISSGDAPSFAKWLDLFMLVWTGGCERTEAEHADLLASADLRAGRFFPTQSPISIIEAMPT